jgi:hypothetical protein
MKLFRSTGSRVGHVEIVVTDADCFDPDAFEESPPTYSEAEIAEAFANRRLTPHQAWYLHMQGRSWQIQVQ